MQLRYNEFIIIFDIKNNAGSFTGYTFPAGIYEICDLILM